MGNMRNVAVIVLSLYIRSPRRERSQDENLGSRSLLAAGILSSPRPLKVRRTFQRSMYKAVGT